MNTQYTFGYSNQYDGDSDDVDMSLRGPLSWMEVTEFYFRYLRACGFIFNKDDVATYLAEHAERHVKVEDDRDEKIEERAHGSV